MRRDGRPLRVRPWLTVVPGPFTINGAKVPYVSYVDGFPHSGTLLYSTDGLSYYQTSDPSLDQQTDAEKVRKLPIKPGAQNDWIQPNSQSPIIPLGGGSAIAPPGLFSSASSVLARKGARRSAESS